MKRYIKSTRYMEKPFNNKVAKINNLWKYILISQDAGKDHDTEIRAKQKKAWNIKGGMEVQN